MGISTNKAIPMKRVRRRVRKVRLSVPLFAGAVTAGALVALIFVWQKPIRSEVLGTNIVAAEYTLKLSGQISPAAAGTIMAMADGLFQNNGLRVRLVAGSGDGDALSAVAADENTISIVSAAGFLKARADGLPIVAFATSFAISPFEFFALPDTTLFGPSDLEGKRIGFSPEPDFFNILYQFASKNSLAQSRLRLVESGTPLQDLLDRKTDVLLGRRDVDGQELERRNIDYKVLSPDSYGIHAPGALYVANERAFAKRRNLEKYLAATAGGWNAVYADYGRTVPIIAKSIAPSLPAPLISRLLDAQRRFLRPFGVRFGELDTRRIRVLEEQLLRRRVIQNPVDLKRAINDDVVKEAYRKEAKALSRVEP
ncbi:ABC transporter substrate-binding protein [Bradyrhizobium xenonodulans]|uniref:ABC transporter substrate-binding protein n=1 Tax=Bradyrhizobium xenonodulans TaxID=2736875 RepID=A0ABY7MRY8_9BRAD|nr:ABC transporter substrate-binding protein [Bradyrhizobium xenonodulans]WBL80304.1 ABC transporter substrate-binding protein [Bradyrhizobium xenonodulans]